MMRRWPLLAVIFLVGCRAGMSPMDRSVGESIGPSIDRVSDAVAGFERDHRSLLGQPANQAAAAFAARAGFEEGFREARAHLEKARQIQKDQVEPLLRANRPEGVDAMMKARDEVRNELTLARAATDRVAKTRSALIRAVNDLPSFSRHVASLIKPLKEREARLVPALNKSKERHPAKRSDLDRRLGEFRRDADDVRNQLKAIDAERAKPAPDLLAVVRSDERATTSSADAEKLAADLDRRMIDLDRTVTRRLEDMRLEYHVTFARSSWSEYSDYDNENPYTYAPVKISLPLAEKISQVNGENVDVNLIREAGLDPFLFMSSQDDGYEFWVEDMDDRAFHKYVETIDGQTTFTDWIPVDDALFDRHEKDLGMEIYVKPYGMYDEEAIRTATPPGLALVGNPRYGSWNGSVWRWLPAYLFYSNLFDGNHRYRRDQWDRWNRDYRGRRPYYGEGEQEEERPYGTNGRYSRVYYGNSNWGRTSGFRNYDLSFRGLGPEYRGGGPGGGGK